MARLPGDWNMSEEAGSSTPADFVAATTVQSAGYDIRYRFTDDVKVCVSCGREDWALDVDGLVDALET